MSLEEENKRLKEIIVAWTREGVRLDRVRRWLEQAENGHVHLDGLRRILDDEDPRKLD